MTRPCWYWEILKTSRNSSINNRSKDPQGVASQQFAISLHFRAGKIIHDMLPNCNTKLQIGCNFMLWNVVALKNTISNGLRVLRVAATSICSVAAGTAFCLPLACKNAPLGQRQGGVFRLPPPYLWTPPTPQRAKGYSPLTILKKKSKHKKASAAPVGAIALTLFSLLHL